ncbi:MAG: xanthine dehydrogenase family protein molybdopterin-binding subunit [Rhodobacteraceae bacterium]|nr:xanthine dehydrogenase family protein molybdopterin-binding subunit [Paracoccaceae bacterium]
MAFKLIGKDFTPPDLEAKVTGSAKYAEDFRADGMAHIKFFGSPMPHARVNGIDTGEALKIPGVLAVLLPEEVKQPNVTGFPILTAEPTYYGQPIVAVAAETEQAAADAVAALNVDMDLLPFVVDPLDSLRPDGANALTGGNVSGRGVDFHELKWSGKDFAIAAEDELPRGPAPFEWGFGDLEAGFAEAKVVVEDSFVHATNSHHAMEPRSAAAFWENGKCHVWGSTQSTSFAQPGLARLIGIELKDLVFVAEYCGGGFGGKGTSYPLMALPALMSKKLGGRPCHLRVSRVEEYNNGMARSGFQGWGKLGFSADGRITAADIFVIQDLGPTSGFPDFNNVGNAFSIVFQPPNMRFRAVPVLTNTVPKGPQRGPGENQAANMFEPLIDKAASELGIDRVAIREVNAPGDGGAGAKIGAKQGPLTSAFLKNAIVQGSEAFRWDERSGQSGMMTGSKARGYGVASAYHSAGSSGFDGLLRITPDGILHVHTGVGNLGTFSYASTSRVAAEVLGYDWNNVIIERGGTARHIPYNLGQFGSNTSFTMSRTNYVAAEDAKAKLLEIAAASLGGNSADYELRDERVVSRSDMGVGITFAEAAQMAVEMGGRYSGEVLPENIHEMTQASAKAIAGTGLVGVAKDTLPKEGTTPALTASFIEVDVDLETGAVEILDYVGVADCGIVNHPTGLAAQVRGGAVMGFGLARTERHVYDPAYGLPNAKSFYHGKPLSYLDVPTKMDWAAVDQPDPQNPMGIKGIGEPLQGSASAALLCAISDALGGHLFNRIPVVTDMIVNAAAGQPQSYRPLATNTV